MKNNSYKSFILIAIIIFGFGAVFVLSNYLKNVNPEFSEKYSDSDLFLQGKRLKGYMFGAEGVVADWYWMRSLQYIGDKIYKSEEEIINIEDLTPLNPKLLQPYLENATALDPQFMAAYSYGAVVLPAIDKDEAIKFIEKGIENNPNEWRLYQHLGFIYWRNKDYNKAAETYEKGSKIDGAPTFFKAMTAKMKNEGGSRETARQIYQQMLDEAEDSNTKEAANLRLLELDSKDEIEVVNKVLSKFKNKNGRCVNNFQEIFPLLRNVKLPNNKDLRVDNKNNLVDPSGIPYLLDTKNCTIKLNPKETKIPLY